MDEKVVDFRDRVVALERKKAEPRFREQIEAELERLLVRVRAGRVYSVAFATLETMDRGEAVESEKAAGMLPTPPVQAIARGRSRSSK